MLAYAGVADIIGERFYLLQLPQGVEYPAASYQRTATVPLYTQDNDLQGTVGYARFQISGFFQGKSSGADSEAFAQAVTKALQTFNCLTPGSPPVLGTPPNYVIGRNMQPQPQTQPPIFMQVIQVKLWYDDSQ